MVELTIPGKPQGKARARTVYNPRINRSVSYTPDNTVLYENLIKTLYLEKYPGERFSKGEALHVRIRAYYEPPKSISKKKREEMLAGDLLPCKKPDIDNIAKAVLDALNGVAYGDDNQVTALEVSKHYAVQAHVDITIFEEK